MKYLGVWVNNKNSNKDHLEERRLKTWRAFYAIKKEIGIDKKEIKPQLKAFIIKTFIRPVAYYGIENIKLSQTDIKKMQTMEALMIKRLLKFNTRTRNRDLLYALSIEPAEIKIKKLKLNFVKRVLENEFTNRIFRSIKTG